MDWKSFIISPWCMMISWTRHPCRRNFPTVHSKWNINQAVLSGDVMAFIANECFLQTPQRCLLKVFREFNKAAIQVCVGQQLDIDFEKATIIAHEEYLRMIELKTAVFVAAAVKIGAIIGGAKDRDAELIYEFGRNLGLSFQIQDDLLDTYGDSKVFGKIPGGDIISNKKTFLLVKAFELASREQINVLHVTDSRVKLRIRRKKSEKLLISMISSI